MASAARVFSAGSRIFVSAESSKQIVVSAKQADMASISTSFPRFSISRTRKVFARIVLLKVRIIAATPIWTPTT